MILSYVFAIFAILGALDKIIGNKFGLGEQFEKGFMLMGTMALTSIGMISLAPVIADISAPFFTWLYNVFRIDSSVYPAFFLANDLGAAPLCKEIAQNEVLGAFNGLIVATMIGASISYSIPVAMGIVNKENHKDMFLGFLCGLITVPVGCFVAGLMIKINVGLLLITLLPLIIFATLVSLGIIFFKNICIKIFEILGKAIAVLILIGLSLAVFKALTKLDFLENLAPYEEGGIICLNSAAVLAGAFPLMHFVSFVLKKPLSYIGQKTGIGATAVLGLLSTTVSGLPTMGVMDKMTKRGVVLNASFIISASCTFGAHIAYTMAVNADYISAMIAGKLISGIAAVIVALLVTRNQK